MPSFTRLSGRGAYAHRSSFRAAACADGKSRAAGVGRNKPLASLGRYLMVEFLLLFDLFALAGLSGIFFSIMMWRPAH
jgi:hypothetical protein